MIGERRLKTPEGKDTDYTVTNGVMREAIWFKFHIEKDGIFETLYPTISLPKEVIYDGLIHDYKVLDNTGNYLFTFQSYVKDGKLFVNARLQE